MSKRKVGRVGIGSPIETLEKRVLLSTVPNDPSFGTDGHHALVDSTNAWDLTTGSASVIVAVLDTGLDISHPDINGNVFQNPGEIANNGVDDDDNGFVDDVNGWDFTEDDNIVDDVDGHGTHVSGTVAAEGNNGVGITGMSWNSKILPVKVLGDSGGGSFDGILEGLRYVTAMKRAGNNIRVVNMSLGGNPQGFPYEWNNAIKEASDAGILVVVAAGNDSANNNGGFFFPAGFTLAADNVIGVAATDNNDELADFSNFGLSAVQVAAPGVDSLSLASGGGYDTKSGTSMASPMVAGLAALAFSLNPNATPVQVKDAILRGVDVVPGLDRPGALPLFVETGGRINAYKALRAVQNQYVQTDTWTNNDYLTSGRFGTEGTLSTLPGYASVTINGASQEPGGPAGVIYHTDSAMTVDLAMTGGTHRVSFVMNDPRGNSVRQTLELVDPTTGDVIDTASQVVNTRNGAIVSFDLTGNNQIRITRDRGNRASVSDITFDAAPVATGAYVGVGDTVGGLWKRAYGSQGAVIAGFTTVLPDDVSITGATEKTIRRNTTCGNALELPGDNRNRRVLGVYSTDDTMTASLSFAADEAHRVSLYATDYNRKQRVQQITIIDTDDDVILDRRLISDFRAGEYFSWDVEGPVDVTVERVNGPDAVFSGLFIDNAPSANFRFLGQDATTGGNWSPGYGSRGAYIVSSHEVTSPDDLIPAVPDFASLSFDGSTSRDVNLNTNKKSAPLKIGSTRQRAIGYEESFGAFTINIDVDQNRPGRVSLYFVDFENARRAIRLTVRDANTDQTLATTEVTQFKNGRYVSFDIQGPVAIDVTNIAALGADAVVSAVYFD